MILLDDFVGDVIENDLDPFVDVSAFDGPLQVSGIVSKPSIFPFFFLILPTR